MLIFQGVDGHQCSRLPAKRKIDSPLTSFPDFGTEIRCQVPPELIAM